MSRVEAARTILGPVAGYAANAAMIAVTEAIYTRYIDARAYFVVDLITQVVATIIGGAVCCLIARRKKRIAVTGLTVLGLLIGTASLITSWNDEPHWYAIALLSVYAPCVWIGFALMNREDG